MKRPHNEVILPLGNAPEARRDGSSEETSTLVDAGNLDTGHYDRTIQGDGTYSRTSTGAGAEMPSDTGAIDYFWEQAGDPHSGVFDLIQTGTDRYDLLEDFYDISNTQPDRSPGHMNWYPFGQTFVDPFWEYVGAGLEGMWDGTKMIANAGLNTVTFGNSPLNEHVNNLIRQNGGAYAFANGAANVGVGAAEFATGATAVRFARTAAAARAARLAEAARRNTPLARAARLLQQALESRRRGDIAEAAGRLGEAAEHRARAFELGELAAQLLRLP